MHICKHIHSTNGVQSVAVVGLNVINLNKEEKICNKS